MLLLRPNAIAERQQYSVPTLSAEQAMAVKETRIFFAHQSVGQSLIDAVPDVFSDATDMMPIVATFTGDTVPQDATLIESPIGTNGDPLGKIAAFDQIIRAGLAADIEVAILKLCYIDINASTDTEALFEAYNRTLADLERDFPEVTFIFATAPLMYEPDLVTRAKVFLGRDSELDPRHNVARHHFNELVREAYGDTGRLFDIAKMESAGSDGIVETKRSDTERYLALDRTIAVDPGHLTPEGAARISEALLAIVASAIDDE
ncbi:hypothetical protein SAMN04489806_1906 [Paramicrobacterium humi]|uniref:GDSL-like Lipase/Acylhydrolase family protein n=2 Tax=Paramicrobacterium humi TaxID=640635 RepID=A0A1H4MKU0_9MICO|nr:hypothetical protein SAMN04489806_1906 [Microbacterium humi]